MLKHLVLCLAHYKCYCLKDTHTLSLIHTEEEEFGLEFNRREEMYTVWFYCHKRSES